MLSSLCSNPEPSFPQPRRDYGAAGLVPKLESVPDRVIPFANGLFLTVLACCTLSTGLAALVFKGDGL
jgi:hypothetical protein